MKKTPAGTLKSLPAPPADLTDTARNVYQTCGRFLLDRGVLCTGDVAALLAYSRAQARAELLDRRIELDGPMTEDGKANPLIASANASHGAAKGWAIILGLASNARTNLPAGDADATPSAAASSPLAQVLTRSRSTRTA
jgi:phage terminase small subunit